jgi:aldose 1-epimerase
MGIKGATMQTQYGAFIRKQPFGQLAGGETIDLYSLTNRNGIEMRVISYGGIVVSMKTPDRAGNFADIVLGFSTLQEYVDHNPYFGALIGRYANRIADGKFTLEGQEYQLPRNNGENHLHGGWRGFDKVVWEAHEATSPTGVALVLRYLSLDGEEGYPGNLTVNVIYTLTDEDEWRIDYRAATDQTTIINLTQHSYFNLAAAGTILNHELFINADEFTPVNDAMIPTGEYRKVMGTPMDFTHPATIGRQLDAEDEQIRKAKGFDHNWVLRRGSSDLPMAASLFEPESRRGIEVYTTQPGLQFYSGNYLDGSLIGKAGQRYEQHAGLCLEAQHFPDSPNHPRFPSTVLTPVEVYRATTIYKFLVG